MTTDPAGLSIYVFGAAEGEGVALRLPDGGWGVVDSCSRSQGGVVVNPVLDFLQERGVEKLEFLCLTHPHADHYKGMSALMDRFEIERFWPPNVKHIKHLLIYLDGEAERGGDGARRARVNELSEIYRKAQELQKRRRARTQPPLLKHPSSTKALYPVPFDPTASFRITALAPSDGRTADYGDGLARCFDRNGRFVPGSRFDDREHNSISSALHIVFGETTIVLGGDVDEKGWRDVLNEFQEDFLSAHAVKVSHHGSSTGYCPGLWRVFSKARKPVAVVTCFASKDLPGRKGLEEILPHVDRLFTTCIDAVSTERLPVGIDRDHWESELALRVEIPGLRRADSYKHGVCGLHFDDRGNYEVELIPPAGELPVRRRERT